MDFIIATVVVGVLLLSLVTSCWRNINQQRGLDNNEYLFGGNDVWRGTLSVVGSYVSLSVFICGSLIAGWKFPGISAGAMVSACALAGVVFVKINKKIPDYDQVGDIEYKTIAKIVAKNIPSKKGRVVYSPGAMYIVLLCVYGFSLICSEYVILREVVSLATSADSDVAMFTTLVFAAFCSYYVWVGGYKGVLRTDFLQLLICLLAFFVLFSFYETHLDVQLPTVAFPPTPEPTGIVKGFFTFVSLVFYYLTILIACIGFWPRVFGSLKGHKSRNRVIIGSLTLIAVIACAALWLGATYMNPVNIQHSECFVSSLAPFIAGFQESKWCLPVLIAAVVSIGLTTVDSVVMTILQSYSSIRNDIHEERRKAFEEKYTTSQIILLLIITPCLVSWWLTPTLSYYLFAAMATVSTTFLYILIACAIVLVNGNLVSKPWFRCLRAVYRWNKYSFWVLAFIYMLIFLIFSMYGQVTFVRQWSVFTPLLIFVIYTIFNSLASIIAKVGEKNA